MKTTMEPLLEQAAAHIAVVVEAKRPTNRPTRKGLIHNNVDKTTEELRRRVQSLEAKLGKDSVKKVKAAKNQDGQRQEKKLGAAVTPSTMSPRSTAPKLTRKKSPTTKKKAHFSCRQQQHFQSRQQKIKEEGYHSQVWWEKTREANCCMHLLHTAEWRVRSCFGFLPNLVLSIHKNAQ